MDKTQVEMFAEYLTHALRIMQKAWNDENMTDFLDMQSRIIIRAIEANIAIGRSRELFMEQIDRFYDVIEEYKEEQA